MERQWRLPSDDDGEMFTLIGLGVWRIRNSRNSSKEKRIPGSKTEFVVLESFVKYPQSTG